MSWTVILLSALSLVSGFRNTEEDDVPGVDVEYKIHVGAGKRECYYQYVRPGAAFYSSYKVKFSYPSR